MITSFVKHNHAYFRCLECGEESMILKYTMSLRYNFPVIDHEKTNEQTEAFIIKHSLCKNPVTQTELTF